MDAANPTWHDLTLPAPTPVRARLHTPASDANGLVIRGGWLVWAHGGSWQYGSAADWHPVTQRLAGLSGWRVLSVDYRLAPAHRHPAVLEDVLTAVDWARARAGEDGLPLAVGGDSAGATLAASAALADRDRDRDRPAGARTPLAAQVLAYPPLDPSCSAAGYHRDPDVFPRPAELRRAWRALRCSAPPPTEPVGTEAPGTGPVRYLTPLDAPDLRHVPPAVLAVGGLDPVADDVLAYADRLRAADVPVDLIHPPGVAHADLLRPDSHLLPRLAEHLRALGPVPHRTESAS
ncbi:alpha/beta hydrolase fold domain-containing protein [Streptomyces sp. NPDC046203]|uniref:alpha/beta hydrolase fold domain-containing protein n=1 Tax=Streptomyces sp. NPDC046203 TaxID=3154602 RepID=UPI003402BE47